MFCTSPLVLLVVLFFHVSTSGDPTSTSVLEAALLTECSLKKLYRSHTEKHGHSRPPHEKAARLIQFRKDIQEVLAIRENPETTWDVDISFTADMTVEERKLYRSGYNASIHEERKEQPEGSRAPVLESVLQSVTAPNQADTWCMKEYLRPVTEKLKGDCWAHSAGVIIEGQLRQKKGRFFGDRVLKVSVQEIYDCGMPGGDVLHGWQYVQEHNHLTTEREGPEVVGREDRMHQCSWYQDKLNVLEATGTRLNGIYKITRYQAENTDLLQYTLWQVSPVSVLVESTVSKLDKYHGGIFKPYDCGPEPDHTMTMVGYGPKHWKLRSTWNQYAENGYVRWSRVLRDCFMLDYIVYPHLTVGNSVQKREITMEEDE